jgi:hypothetical protein
MANLGKQDKAQEPKNRQSLIINEFAKLRKYILGGHKMKIREILMFNEQDLADGSAGLIGADLIRPVLDQIRPSNGITGRREPLVQATPAAANPDDVPGIEQPPQVGIESMGLAPMDTPPRWDIDRIESQVARLPRHRQVSRR